MMFEKEAEKRTEEIRSISWFKEDDDYCEGYCIGHEKGFQTGAEYGYNLCLEEKHYLEKHWRSVVEERKANEWHDLRKDPNDLPKENMKQVMVVTNYNECLMGWYCIHQKTWYSSDCPDPDDYIETEDIINKIKVIAWKEIVLPELKESE